MARYRGVFDSIRVKIRDEDSIKNQAIPIALGVRYDGRKEVVSNQVPVRHHVR
jgi:transposase-like protein